MKELAIYVDEIDGEISLVFRKTGQDTSYYYRPLSYLARLGQVFQRLWHTDNYTIRPFLGARFGVVVMKVK